VTGFLFKIRRLFQAKCPGRYLALLLRELAFQDPKAFAAVFKLGSDYRHALQQRDFQLESEWNFVGSNSKRRRAGLALLVHGCPILLVEVKEDDVKSPGNSTQLTDYVGYPGAPRECRTRPRPSV
jgi:hypothetical protein